MTPIDFKEKNFIFTKPFDMTDGECESLPVWRGHFYSNENGKRFPTIVSCWKFSEEDLEQIKKTGIIWLSVTGNGTPPVNLFTENPFNNEAPSKSS